MRLRFLLLVAVAPLDACSNTLVTAPPPPVPAPTVVMLGASVPQERVIIVDGVVVDRAVMIGRGNLNPADVEQIEVIKGPAAASLYGEERHCPPIIIRTKRQSAVRVERNATRQ